MASAEDPELKAFLSREKLPAQVVSELASSLTLEAFAFLANTPDDVQRVLESSLSPGATATLGAFGMAGLKSAWSRAVKKCLSANAASMTGTSGQGNALPSASSSSTWTETFPAKLSAAFVKDSQDKFEQAYPSEVLDTASFPSARMLALAHKHHGDRTYKFISWKHRLSEEHHDELALNRARKVPRLEDLIYDDIPLREVPESGMSKMLLHNILELNAIAYSLLEAAHLSSFRAYNKLFMKLAFARLGSDSGLRGPSTTEMQQADKEVWNAIGDLTSKGWSLDDALHELVNVRSTLYSLLQPRPMPLKLGKGKGKGKDIKGRPKGGQPNKWITSYEEEGKKMELCKQWNLRSGCRRKNCHFIHKCCIERGGKPCLGDHPAFQHPSS